MRLQREVAGLMALRSIKAARDEHSIGGRARTGICPTFRGGLNWSTQHFIFLVKDGVLVMCQRYRRGFTAAEKTELWDRWQRGESLKAIGRAFSKPSSSIYCQVAPHGGIRPAPRRRSRLALTLSEREEISRGLAGHQSTRSMARLLGRSASTVSRELAGMVAVIATERRRPTRRPGSELVVRNVVSWRTVRGYDRRWRGSSD